MVSSAIQPINDSPKHAAFFDLDRTLLAKSSGDLYIRHLRLNGQIRLMGLVNMITASILYRLNLLKPEGTMDKLARQYRGLAEQEMIDFGEKWFQDTVKNYLYTDEEKFNHLNKINPNLGKLKQQFNLDFE